MESLRKERGFTRAEVAKRCAWLGMPEITPAALSNIETGRKDENGRRRRDITVDELVVLAMALETVPASLLAPVGSGEPIEVIPGRPDDAWSTYRWLIGDLPGEVLGEPRDPTVQYLRLDQAGATISAYEQHDKALHAWLRSRDQQSAKASKTDPLTVLAGTRIQMAQAGWWLPPLPEFVHAALEDPLQAWGWRREGQDLVRIALHDPSINFDDLGDYADGEEPA